MEELERLIAAQIARWNTAFVEEAIFGTRAAREIAAQVAAFCVAQLGSAIDGAVFYEASQGAVCGLRLTDGRRVVLKAHQPDRPLAFLQAVSFVQSFLAERDYPCPRPLLAPTLIGRGYALVETLEDAGEFISGHEPPVRQAMAGLLARIATLTDELVAREGERLAPLRPPRHEGLWRTPHSKIFDFKATTAGAEWIDALAREARVTLLRGAGQAVIGHGDWSAKHLRFVAGRVSVVYDWDSLLLDQEPEIVGAAATTFTQAWGIEEQPTLPAPNEARAFVAEYEAARGRAFSPPEWEVLAASATCAIAYGARCQHSLDPHSGPFPEGSLRDTLARYGADYLAGR